MMAIESDAIFPVAHGAASGAPRCGGHAWRRDMRHMCMSCAAPEGARPPVVHIYPNDQLTGVPEPAAMVVHW